jgi:quercetin dioxygenase-like cupin family protein
MTAEFDPTTHIQNVFSGPSVSLFTSAGDVLPGIAGVIGAVADIENGMEVGVDRITMNPGSRFELHIHPGAHILYVLRNRGFIHVDGVDYDMVEGDTVFVPANFAHGVKTNPEVEAPLEFLAFGVPHMALDSTSRMTLVEPDPAPPVPGEWRWELATDPEPVHELLCRSDVHHAAHTGTPVPRRNWDSTDRHVRSSAVHVLRRGDELAAMFTLSDHPPFNLAETAYQPATRPVYLQRLAVAPHLLEEGSLVGVRCVRRAIELAERSGADVLRSEANPDLAGPVSVLHQSGFVQRGPVHADSSGRRWVHLERSLAG